MIGLARARQDRAFRLGVANGILFEIVAVILQPATVMSAFILRLTGSTLSATVPAALGTIGTLWPQLLASNLAEARPRKQPLYVATSIVRALSVAAMALAVSWAGRADTSLLVPLVLLFYFAYTSAAGAGTIAFMDIVGKTVPPPRRGTFWGLRGFYGGWCALATGFLVRHMLGPSGPAFPRNFAWLYALAAAVLVVAASAFAAVPEPVRMPGRPRLPLRRHLARGLAIFRTDRSFRQLYLVGLLSSLATCGPIVFVPYAIRSLGFSEGIVGTLIVASSVVVLPANFVWSRMSDGGANRRLYLVSNRLYLAAGVLAVASALAPDGRAVDGLPAGWGLRALCFLPAWVLSALAGQSRGMAATNYMLALAPEDQRPSYMAFMSVLQAPMALVPLLAGALAEIVSFTAVLVLSLTFAVAAHAAIARLDEVAATPAR